LRVLQFALAETPFKVVPEGLEVQICVIPNASRDSIGDVVADAQGNGALKLAVTAVPEKGKANTAVIKLLAKSWRLRKTDCQVIRGQTERYKTLFILGDGKNLKATLQQIIDHST
jgi:uncharacterized protein (TIGR00251 family)